MFNNYFQLQRYCKPKTTQNKKDFVRLEMMFTICSNMMTKKGVPERALLDIIR